MFPQEKHLMIEYRDVVSEPDRVLASIIQYLGIGLLDNQRLQLVDQHRKERIRQSIDAADQTFLTDLGSGKSIDISCVVLMKGAQMPVFDEKTGFQTGHIGDC